MSFYICVILSPVFALWVVKRGGFNWGCGEKLTNPAAAEV